VLTKARRNVTPRLRLGCGQGEQGRVHTAGFPQGHQAMPLLGGDGLLHLFMVIAAVGSDDHLTRSIRADILFQLARLDVLHDEVMVGAILQRMILAIALALERDGSKRNQPGIEEQHHGGPLMPHDNPLAMMDGLGVFWMQTGAMLEGTIDDNRNGPGQLGPLLPGFSYLPGLLRGAAFQGRDCDLAMGLQHLRKLGLVPSGKPGGFLEGMCPGHDHQKQEVTRADVCKTSTDQEMTGAPSLHSLRAPVASPMSRWRYEERRIL